MRKDRVVSEVLGEETVLTPSDLYDKEFRRALFGGYQRLEVDAFLERIADALEPLIRQLKALKAAQEEYKAQIQEHRHMEETLRNALVTSQKFGENLIDSAKREADTLIAAARVERERVESNAARLPVALGQEIAQLQEQRNRLRSEILGILKAHKALLDGLDSAEEAVGNAVFFGFRDAASPDSDNPVAAERAAPASLTDETPGAEQHRAALPGNETDEAPPAADETDEKPTETVP